MSPIELSWTAKNDKYQVWLLQEETNVCYWQYKSGSTTMCMMVSGFLGMAGVSNTPSWSMLVRDDYCSNKSPNGANIREK